MGCGHQNCTRLQSRDGGEDVSTHIFSEQSLPVSLFPDRTQLPGGPRSCWRDNTSMWILGRPCPVSKTPRNSVALLDFSRDIPWCVGPRTKNWCCDFRFGSRMMTSKSSRRFWHDPTLKLVRIPQQPGSFVNVESADI